MNIYLTKTIDTLINCNIYEVSILSSYIRNNSQNLPVCAGLIEERFTFRKEINFNKKCISWRKMSQANNKLSHRLFQ